MPASTFAGAPRLHDGGMAGDEFPAILQQGEMVIPEDFGSQFLLMLEELSKLFTGFGEVSDSILKSAVEASDALTKTQDKLRTDLPPVPSLVKTQSIKGSPLIAGDVPDTGLLALIEPFNESMNSATAAVNSFAESSSGAIEAVSYTHLTLPTTPYV